jgi:hypothetical protein
LLDEFLIEVDPLGQDHLPKGTCVLVVAMRLDGDVFAESYVSNGVLGSLTECLAFLRAVDAAQADVFRLLVVQDLMVSPSIIPTTLPVKSAARQGCTISRAVPRKASAPRSTRRMRPRVLMDYFCFATILYLIPSYVARGRIFFCTSSSFRW